MTMYYCDHCKKCGRSNLVYYGDPSDCTGPEPTGFRCWNCKSVSHFDGDEFEGSREDIDQGEPTAEDERKRCADAVRKRLPTELDHYDVGHSAVSWAECKMMDAINDIEEGGE